MDNLDSNLAARQATTNILPTYSYADLSRRPKPKWSMDNVQQKRGVGMIHGKPGSMKTFIALDMCLSMAVGREYWHGNKINEPVKCLYILAEGVEFFPERIDGWIQRNSHLDYDSLNENFRVHDEAVNLLNPDAVNRVIDTALQMGAQTIVFDTMRRMLAGKDENSSQVGSAVINNMDLISKTTGGFSWLLHHDSKMGDASGSTAFDGGLDVRFQTVENMGQIELVNKKMKNAKQPDKLVLTPVISGPSVVLESPASTWDRPARTDNLYSLDLPHLVSGNLDLGA